MRPFYVILKGFYKLGCTFIRHFSLQTLKFCLAQIWARVGAMQTSSIFRTTMMVDGVPSKSFFYLLWFFTILATSNIRLTLTSFIIMTTVRRI